MSNTIDAHFESNIHVACDEICSKDKAVLFSNSPYTSNLSPAPITAQQTHQTHFQPSLHHPFFSPLSSSTCSTSSSSSSASSRADSITKSDFHIVGGKIRPTLKCIRNTLNLSIDSSRRYDRLSSSKSDLHLALSESSVDDSECQVAKSSSCRNTNHKNAIPQLNISYNSVDNLASTDCSPKSSQMISLSNDPDSKLSSNSSAMLLSSTNTLRSFIKTKSTGIIIRKENADNDDEEVEKLCDSKGSKVSTECLVSSANALHQVSAGHVQSTSSPYNQTPFQDSSDSSLVKSQPTSSCYSHSSCQQNSICSFLANKNNSQTLADDVSNAAPSTEQFHHQVSLFNQSKSVGEGKKMYNIPASIVHQTDMYYSCPTKQMPPFSGSKSNSKRHQRANFIQPILKANRFVKQSKGNLLFNANTKTSKNQPKKRFSSESIYADSSQEIVESLKSDRMVMTQPDEDRRRRTIIIEKQNNSFGFTLQTYGIKHSREGEVELITYVDEVTYGGPAFRGGMRPGDVILSINGRDVEKADHRSLVTYINSCEKTMRLVVLFEDCVRKIELNLKFIKLKKTLQQKMTQLEILKQRENQILINAAIRNCSDRGHDEQAKTNNLDSNGNRRQGSANDHCSDNKDSQTGLTFNKSRCKSLDVSLNDINCNNQFEDDHWPDPGAPSDINQSGRNFSTDLSRKLGSVGEVVLENNESTTKTEHTTLPHKSQRNSQSRSKSLPQSIANSLDCLTNEAYEDDEDVFVGGEQNWAQLSKSTDLEDKSSRSGNKNSSLMATSDKDFITKL